MVTASLPPGYPIRLSADLRICAAPRGFSQLITAFFASQLLGIHHKPILRLTILSFPLLTNSLLAASLSILLYLYFKDLWNSDLSVTIPLGDKGI